MFVRSRRERVWMRSPGCARGRMRVIVSFLRCALVWFGFLFLMRLCVSHRVQADLYLLAWLHCDCEGDALESGDEVEGAFFGGGCEALRCGSADGERAFWFGDLDGFEAGLGDGFG